MLRFIRARPVVSFMLLTLLITYAVGLPWMLATLKLEQDLGLPEELLSLVFMRAGPTIAGLIVVAALADGRGIMIWLKQLFRWRVHPGYYLVLALLATAPFILTVSLIIPLDRLTGSAGLSAARDWSAIGVDYLRDAAYRIVTNGEETGWRFAMLGLLVARMRVFPALIIVGVGWAFWHMPAFFLFGQAALWYPLVPICLAWSVLFSWFYLRTHSLLLCVIVHGAANATFYTFERQFPGLSAQYDAIEPVGDWVYAAIALGLALLLLLLDRKLFFSHAASKPGEEWAQTPGAPAPKAAEPKRVAH